MATIQRSTTKTGAKLVNYVKNEEKATVKSGYNLDIERANEQMKLSRHLYSKNDGIQAHHVVQSFQPGEVTPQQANEIGLQLADEIAREHEVAVYTHTDREHIHNHLVINSINLNTGLKFQTGGKKGLYELRDKSDEICREHGLSVIQEYNASVRYTLAEKQILDKGQISWKAEIREAINYVKSETNSFENFKNQMEADFDIEVKLRGKTVSFKHPERNKVVRGKKLGADYEMEAINREFTREARPQTTRKEVDWDEYERINQLQSENVGNRTSERADSSENRPISRKYREEQRANEREHQSNNQSDRKQQQSVKQQDKGFER